MKKILHRLETPWWLFILLFILLLLRIPSLFEPYSYGDEMIYLSLGEAVRKGLTLYKSIHDNKPPLLYLIAAISGNLFWFKSILAVWMITTTFIFWKLTTAVLPKNKLFQIISTAVFGLLTTLPKLEGNIANAELFMTGPTILAFYLLLTCKLNPKTLIASGVLFSVSTLFKMPAAFDMLTIIFVWLVMVKKIKSKTFKKIVINSLFLMIGFASPILISLFWYGLKGAFNQYLVAAFLQNIGYLSTWRPDDVQKPFLVKNAPLLTRGLLATIILGVLFIKRKLFSNQFLFVTAWLVFSLFAVTLSERPYPHYLIQSIPAVSMLVGMLVAKKDIEQVLVIAPLSLFLVVPVYYHYWNYPTLSYYNKFFQFFSGKIDKTQYLSTFGGHIPTAYDISSLITSTTNPNDKIFVWGPDSSTIYALSKRLPPIRYVADYHIRDFYSPGLVVEELKNNMPIYVIILPGNQVPQELQTFINENYAPFEEIDNAAIFKLLNEKVRGLISK